MESRFKIICEFILVITSSLIASSCSLNSSIDSEYIILQNATIIDGTGNPPVDNQIVVIKGETISQIGKYGEIELPKGGQIIDVKGKWIIPGFIDLHIHFWESGRTWAQPTFVYDLREFVSYEEEVAFMKGRISYTLEKYLCSGVTSVVPLGAIDWEYEVRELANQLEKAPNVYLAGGFIANYPTREEWPAFDGKRGGYWLESSDDAKELIRFLDSTDVDLIKAGFISKEDYPMETFQPKLEAIIEASHQKNLKVSVHATELSSAKRSLQAGADVLAHTVADSIIDKEFIQLARQNNAIITSSLGVISSYNEILTGTYSLTDQDLCCGDPEVIESWKEWAAIPASEKPPIPSWILDAEHSLEIMLQNTRIAYESGLPICIGSDGGNIGSLHGPSFHRELRLLAEAGLSPMDILVAATKNGALALDKEEELGTVEIGKQADLLILNSNPLESVENFNQIDKVIVKGKLIDRKDIVETNCE